MKLDKKKALAARIFGVSKERIIFVEPRLDEIKEAITKEDIRGLKEDGAIVIKGIKAKRGRHKKEIRRSAGNIRKQAKNEKRDYISLTRKLRKYVADSRRKKLLTKRQTFDLKKKIRNKYFRDKSHLKEYISTFK